ncbi:hypothetical protein DFH09DRAFT_1069362 [Mycena vulgaris]|nr:hypothetical protein DFH09DRAFT_1069362 [Mycena vulgaris]
MLGTVLHCQCFLCGKSDVPVVKSSKARAPGKPRARLPRPDPAKSRRERVTIPDPAMVTYRIWLPEELEGDTDEECEESGQAITAGEFYRRCDELAQACMRANSSR